jgi:hypothetical protein
MSVRTEVLSLQPLSGNGTRDLSLWKIPQRAQSCSLKCRGGSSRDCSQGYSSYGSADVEFATDDRDTSMSMKFDTEDESDAI